MPHPLYGPPRHRLESVELTLTLPSRRNGYQTFLAVRGRASTSRSDLWVVRETWNPSEVDAGLQPTDAAYHVLLVAAQDRPDSQSALEAQLTGGGWEDVPLPF